MILILDTNAVRMLNPNGSNADVLRIIKTSGKAKIAVPEMVLHEMLAQQVIEYRDAYVKAVSAVKRAYGRHPGLAKGFSRLPEEPDIYGVRREWDKQYRAIFTVIPTSGEAALKALVREANGEKPAKMTDKQGEKKKEGARDVAIWLSVVDFMKKYPNEQVYFVTKNSKDFGDGSGWPSPMDADIQGMEHRITLLEDMDAVISEFTEEVPASELSADAATALMGLSQTVGELAIKKLHGKPRLPASLLSGFDEGRRQFKRTGYRRWVAPPDAELLNVSNVTGHKIGDSVWFVADVEWLLWGLALSWVPDRGVIPVMCIWETRVLMTTSGTERATVLSDRPVVKGLLPEDRDKWEPVFERLLGSINGLMASDTQELVSRQLLNYSDENRNLIAHLPRLIVGVEGETEEDS
ncbi:PIN domain-containing protein [Streptomyces sp. NPDC006602]|uniref:PIN domain-containing protein n=1 Tax=Streptomyces sp. NPDC006602 TaxID=3364751 RepID=UPI0036A70839